MAGVVPIAAATGRAATKLQAVRRFRCVINPSCVVLPDGLPLEENGSRELQPAL